MIAAVLLSATLAAHPCEAPIAKDVGLSAPKEFEKTGYTVEELTIQDFGYTTYELQSIDVLVMPVLPAVVHFTLVITNANVSYVSAGFRHTGHEHTWYGTKSQDVANCFKPPSCTSLLDYCNYQVSNSNKSLWKSNKPPSIRRLC